MLARGLGILLHEGGADEGGGDAPAVAVDANRHDRLNEHIDAFAHLYNHSRPHGALGGRTPSESLTLTSQKAQPSHMY
ncbi:MAG: transposase [Pseudolabrys sp.]|nr:transposase [Pseudolabrys sp.]